MSVLARTREAVEAGIASGQHLGCQIYVSAKGQVVADIAIGQSRAGVPLRNTDLMLWLSAGKPVAAVAILQLWERGKLDLDDPVASHIPEFAAGSKEKVTIRYLLTHTGGLRGVANTWSSGTWDELIARICAAPPEAGWTAGRKAGYHVASSWFILGELVRRLDGRPFEQYVRDDMFLPLGMNDCWIGMPEEDLRRYESEARIAPIYDTSKGQFDDSYPGNLAKNITSCRPGGNGRGPARELARLYECLLNRGKVVNPSGEGMRTKILTRQSIEAMAARHRVGMVDSTFRHKIDWGLGVIVNSAHYDQAELPYGFGPHASPRCFGHSGSQSSIAFADPEHQLAAAIIFNGMPGEDEHNQRMTPVLGALYEDLNLTL